MLYAKLAGAKLYPSVDLLARGGGKMSGDSSRLAGRACSPLIWELDLWGRVRYGRAAAAADAASAQADFEYARQSIAALVARSWFLATEAALQADAGARHRRATARQLVRLAEDRVAHRRRQRRRRLRRAGDGRHATATPCARSSSRASRRFARSSCCIGRYPAAAIGGHARSCPAQPAAVPAGLPSELLERRPDVIAAERRVAAAFHRVGEAKAARLPAIALTAGVSCDLERAVRAEGAATIRSGTLGANLLAPIFQGGALKTQVEIRTAEQKEAVAAYAAVGLRAFGEVEDALVGRNRRPRSRADPGADARRQPARARDRADAVQGRQHRPALRHPAAARAATRASRR